MILNNFLEHISPQVAKKDAIEEPLLIENLLVPDTNILAWWTVWRA